MAPMGELPVDWPLDVHEALAAAGVKAVLNFAPARVQRNESALLKNVDLRINLEELAFFLRR